MAVYLALGAEIDVLQEARAAAKQVVADVFVETGIDRLARCRGPRAKPPAASPTPPSPASG
jgi:hypothetical protein